MPPDMVKTSFQHTSLKPMALAIDVSIISLVIICTSNVHTPVLKAITIALECGKMSGLL